MNGQDVKVLGTPKSLWNIPNIWTSQHSFRIKPLQEYIFQVNPFSPYRHTETPCTSGTIYCVEFNGKTKCIHESWTSYSYNTESNSSKET
jgi:hypothetical protein